MIKSITITNYVGDSITIDPANPYSSGLAITDMTGLATLDATINASEVATNDGTVYNSARVQPRDITITLKPLWTENKSIEENRRLIYKYFPIKKPLTLTIATDDRTVQITGYVENTDTTIFSNFETGQVSLYCPDPYFEDIYTDTLLFSGIVSNFEFPFGGSDTETPNTENSLELSQIRNDTIREITYDGDIETGMEISIHAIGDVSDIVIYNLSTNESMGIKGDLQALDDIVICTIRNKKTARLLRHGVYTNILNKLSKDSDWFELQKGNNIIAYTAEKGQENLQFSIKTKVLYEGI